MKISSIRKYSMWPEKKLVKCFIVCFLYIYDFVPSHTSLFILATEFVLNVCSLSFLAFLQFTHSMFSSSIFFPFRSLARPPDKKKITMNQCNRNRYLCVFVHLYMCCVYTIDLPKKNDFDMNTRTV